MKHKLYARPRQSCKDCYVLYTWVALCSMLSKSTVCLFCFVFVTMFRRQADRNGDGKISPEEFMVIATKFPNILFPASKYTSKLRKIMK